MKSDKSSLLACYDRYLHQINSAILGLGRNPADVLRCSDQDVPVLDYLVEAVRIIELLLCVQQVHHREFQRCVEIVGKS